MTPYRVFQLDTELGNEGTARQIGPDTVHANSAHQAIRHVISDRLAIQAGTFVAVPARSWQPVTVTTETTVRVKLETA